MSLTHKKHTFRHLPILKHLAPCVHDYLLDRSVTESYPHKFKVPFKSNEQLDFILVLKGQLSFTLKHGWSSGKDDQTKLKLETGKHLCHGDLHQDKQFVGIGQKSTVAASMSPLSSDRQSVVPNPFYNARIIGINA